MRAEELQKVEKEYREAVTKNDVDRVRQIIQKHRTIPIDDPCLGNEPALHLAIKRGWMSLAALLLELKADPNRVNLYEQQTPLHMCIRYRELEILKLLVPLKPSPNIKDKDGNTPLHIAAQVNASEEIVLLLLSLGADPFLKDSKGQYAKDLYLANGGNAQAQILAICEPIVKARTAKVLDLSTRLRTIAQPLSPFGPLIWPLSNLVTLNLSSNLLELIPVDVKLLVSLESLDLSDNRISRLPPLNTLKALRRLDLRANRLIALPPELGNMQQLKELLVADNPLGTVPLGIDRSSTTELKNYFDGLPARRVKLLVLGPEGVGKTSLIECLKGLAIQSRTTNAAPGRVDEKKKSNLLGSLTSKITKDKEEKKGADLRVVPAPPKTELIDIFPLTLDEDVTFWTYDFGREEIIYPTHQFFITANAVYVLLFHMADINRLAIEYWLQTIKARTGNFNCLVLIVGTHADEVPNREAMEKELEAKWMAAYKSAGFVHIQGITFVSCKTKDGIPKLRDLLVGIAKNKLAQSLNEVIPNSYISVLEYLCQLRSANVATLEWSEFKEIPAKVNQYSLATDEKLSAMAKCLHKLGEIIYFEYDSVLKDYIILDPLTLVRLMTTVISLKTHYAKDAILKTAILPTVWKAFPAESHQTLLHVLRKFEVIFPLRDDHLVPCLLPERPASEQEQFAHWPPLLATEVSTLQFGRHYVFAFLPVGLFWRIMVRLMSHSAITPIYKWRYGIVVRMAHQSALLTADLKGQCVSISLREPGKINATPRLPQERSKSLLKTLMVIVEGLVEQFYPSANKDLRRLVPCSHCYARIKHTKGGTMEVSFERENSVHLFTYEECLEALAAGHTILGCPNEGSAVVPIGTVAPDILKDEPLPNDEITHESILGVGGYGRVYKGTWHPNGGERVAVAIKELLEDSGEAYQALFQNFQLEAYIMSNLNHPNIVKLYGITISPLSLVMELMPFGDLHDLLEPRLKAVLLEEFAPLHLPVEAVLVVEGEGDQPGTYKVLTERNTRGSIPASKLRLRKAPLPDSALSTPLRMRILLDIARGMNYLATRSPPIVHRDLRSPNVFISELNLEKQHIVAKIADFGLAREVLQETSGILKAWQWLAPEIIDPDKNEYDEKSDIYSYGMVCWEVLRRGTPFDEYYEDPRFLRNGAFQAMDCRVAVFRDGLRPTLPADVDPEVRRVVESCWRADPGARMSFEEISISLAMLLGLPPEAYDKNRKPTLATLRTKLRGETTTGAANDFLAFRQRLLPTNADYNASPVMCLLYIPAMQHVWSGGANGSISVWDVPTKSLVRSFDAHNPPTVTGLTLVKDEAWSIGVDEDIHVWDIRTCKKLKTLRGHKAVVRLCMHLSDEIVWSADVNGSVVVWSASQKRKVDAFQLEQGVFSACLIGAEMWFGSQGAIYRVSVTSYAVTKMVNAHEGPVTAIVLAPNGRVWSASQDQHIKAWDVRTYSLVSDIRDVKARINALTIYQSKKNVLVSGSSDKRIVCFNLEHLTTMQVLEGNHTHAIKVLLVVGRDVWAGSLDSTITIWTAPANLNQSSEAIDSQPTPQYRTLIPIRPSSTRDTEVAAAQVQGLMAAREGAISPRPYSVLGQSRALSIRADDEKKKEEERKRKEEEEKRRQEEEDKKREEERRRIEEERKREEEEKRKVEEERKRKEEEERKKREEERRIIEERRKKEEERRLAAQKKIDDQKNAVKNATEARQRAVLLAWQAQLAGEASGPGEEEDDIPPPAYAPPAAPSPTPSFVAAAHSQPRARPSPARTFTPPPPPSQAPPTPTSTAAPLPARLAKQSQITAALEDDLASLLSDLDAAVATKSTTTSPVVAPRIDPSSLPRTPVTPIGRSPQPPPSSSPLRQQVSSPQFTPSPSSLDQVASRDLTTSGKIRRMGDNPLASLVAPTRPDAISEHGDRVLYEADLDAPPMPSRQRSGW